MNLAKGSIFAIVYCFLFLLLINVWQRYEKTFEVWDKNIPDTLHDRLRWIDAAGNNESRNAALFVEQSGF